MQDMGRRHDRCLPGTGLQRQIIDVITSVGINAAFVYVGAIESQRYSRMVIDKSVARHSM